MKMNSDNESGSEYMSLKLSYVLYMSYMKKLYHEYSNNWWWGGGVLLKVSYLSNWVWQTISLLKGYIKMFQKFSVWIKSAVHKEHKKANPVNHRS